MQGLAMISLFVFVVVGMVLLFRLMDGESMPWSVAFKAERARRKKWEQHYAEFLGYGYGRSEARYKADSRMEADAKAAETVLDRKAP